MARLAALVPTPRMHLTRYHGVFAPHSQYRSTVTPAQRARGAATPPVSTVAPGAPAALLRGTLLRSAVSQWPGALRRGAPATRIAQARHAAPKLGRNIRLVARNKVVGRLGPDGRLKFLSATELTMKVLHTIAYVGALLAGSAGKMLVARPAASSWARCPRRRKPAPRRRPLLHRSLRYFTSRVGRRLQVAVFVLQSHPYVSLLPFEPSGFWVK
jgi:hypothetical protein